MKIRSDARIGEKNESSSWIYVENLRIITFAMMIYEAVLLIMQSLSPNGKSCDTNFLKTS